MYSFCNNKIDKENVSVWASLYIQKETEYVRVGFGWVFAFINTTGEKLNLLTLLWSSYPLTLATFLVKLHDKKIDT